MQMNGIFMILLDMKIISTRKGGYQISEIIQFIHCYFDLQYIVTIAIALIFICFIVFLINTRDAIVTNPLNRVCS